MRLDGVDGVQVKNLEIFDIYDSSPVGKETCGNYDDFCALCGTSGGHFRQTLPMQVGFTGNMAQAINVNAAKNVEFEDVSIYDITSETGPAFGISIWPECDVTLKGTINVERISAGVEIEKGVFEYSDRPNKAPETCAIRGYYRYGKYTTSIDSDDASISTKCIAGHVGCRGHSDYTMVGDYDEDCDVDDWDSEFMDSTSVNVNVKVKAKAKPATQPKEKEERRENS